MTFASSNPCSATSPGPSAQPSRTPRFAVDLLGVLFAWYGDRTLRPPALQPAKSRLLAEIDGVAGAAQRRQKRTTTDYMDAFTFMEQGRVAESVQFTWPCQHVQRVLKGFGDGKLDPADVGALTNLPVIDAARGRLRVCGGGRHLIELVVPRTGPMVLPVVKPTRGIRTGVHRVIEIDQTALGVDPTTADIDQMMLAAVTVQLHADLELFYETGFRRTRRCERRACRCWYLASLKDARSRFCSTACRVGHARADARPAGRSTIRRSK